MLPAGLWLLLRLRARGFLRKIFKGARDPRKAAVLVAVYGSSLFMFLVFGVVHLVDDDFGTALTGDAVSVLLFTLCFIGVVSALFEFPIGYVPAEIQFLFPAPFSRRALLAYKLIQFVPMAVYLAVIGATVLVGISLQWIPAFLGIIVFEYITLVLAVAFGLAVQVPIVRPVLLVTLLAAALYAAFDIGRVVLSLDLQLGNTDAHQYFDQLRRSPSYRTMIASVSPVYAMLFEPLGSAKSIISFAESLGFLFTALGLAFILDGKFHELTLRTSARREARTARFLRGQSMRGISALGSRVRLPMFPRLGGAGPIARRYLLAVAREKTTLWMVAIAVVAPACVAGYLRARGDLESLDHLRWYMVAMPIYLTFIVVNFVRFDFRADYVVLDYLKTLPVRPIPVAIGGVLTPTIFATSIQTLPSIVYAIVGGTAPAPLRFLFLLLPANFIWFALDNAFYLRAPSPMRRGMNADPNEIARQLLSMSIRGLIIGMALAVIAGSYALVRFTTDSVFLATGTAWLVVLPIAAWTAYIAGVALRNLDLSRDVL